MGNAPKMTTFLIALIWTSFFMVIVGTFIANVTGNYGVAFDRNNTDSLNKLSDLNVEAKKYQDNTDIEEPSGILDVIGGYFSSAYNTIKLTGKSFDIFSTMASEALGNENLNFIAADSLTAAIMSTIIVLIFIGIFIAAIVKRDLNM